MNQLIEINDLIVKRNDRVVLEVPRLSIPRGETLTVVGPNGAGKSTLLLALAQLIRPARGEIRFGGVPLREWNELEYRRKIAFVFQSPLLMDMTVEQNVALGLKFRGVAREEIRKRAGEWMSRLGVDSLSKRRAGQLSGGEAQRVSLARAFVLDPELLLLDEPFAGVDPISVIEIQKIVRHLTSRGIGVLITDHNVRETLGICDRAYIISEGNVLAEGTPEEIVANPDVRKVYLGEHFRM